MRLTRLPAYITTIIAPSVNWWARGYSYATIDNPAGGTVEAGLTLAYNGVTSGQQADLVTINVGPGAPTSFRIGYITGTSINIGDYVQSIRLRQTAGTGAGSSGIVPTNPEFNDGIDIYFFTVTGATSGDAFTFSGSQTIPQPSGQLHLTLAGLFL